MIIRRKKKGNPGRSEGGQDLRRGAGKGKVDSSALGQTSFRQVRNGT